MFLCCVSAHCPLIWMFHSRAMEHRIKRTHKRALRRIYQHQNQLAFKELLEKSKPVAITRVMQTLATET